MNQNPTIGRIVHYVLANGEHRAATVVNADAGQTPCNLVIDLDPFADFNPGDMLNTSIMPPGHHNVYARASHPGQLVAQSVSQDEDTKAPGTWHWPERT